MKPMEIRHFAAVAGLATDEATGKPVRGARAEIVDAPKTFRARTPPGDPERFTVMFTGSDGHFHFMDLPNGAYEIRVSAPGAVPASAKVKVERAPGAIVRPEIADVTLAIPPAPGAPPVRGARAKLDRRARERKAQ